MTEASEIDTELEAEALALDVPYRAYVEMSPRERGLAKARRTRQLNAEARRLGVDPEWWNGIAEEQREEERPKLLAKADEEKKASDVADVVYTEDAEVPPVEADPRKRDGVTVGRIEEKEAPPDVLGNERVRNPRTLMDLYARWPVGDGQHYVRVERIQPKVWQQIRCAGYLGDIREQISESTFQRYFGGTEYELTLYGPDPSGKTDAITGLPKIKALTNSFKLVVPTLPPNLAVLPALKTNQEAQQEKEMTQQWNPFAPASGGGAPTTPADAQVHKANIDLLGSVFKFTSEENRDLRRRLEEGGGGAQKATLDYLSKQSEQTLEQARADAAAREQILRDQIAAQRDETRALKEDLQRITAAAEKESGRRGDPLDLIRALGETSKTTDSQAREFYEQRLRAQEDQHKSVMTTMEERHKGEITRADQRLKDSEDYYKRMLDDERRKADERERHLKDEIDRVRREERELSDKRVADVKERYEERLKDQEKAYEREIRSVRDMAETRMTTTVATKDFELAAVRERYEEAKEEAAEARAKAEENNDPATVMDKAKKQAEALGYKAPSDDPKTGWERFGTMAGEGFRQFMSKADTWLPGFLARYQPPPGAAVPGGTPQLPPGAQQRQQQQPGPRSRGVAWAAANQPPPVPVEVPDTPLGFQSQPTAPPAGAAPATPPAAQSAPPPAAAQGAQQNPLGQVFTDAEVMGFLQNLDAAINVGMEPSDFAQRFIAMAPAAATKAVAVYKPEDVVKMVKDLPGADASSILRRDGKQFVADLWDEIKKQQRATAQNAAAA